MFLALLLYVCHHVALRGITLAVRILVVEVQSALVEVRLDILGDGLAVVALDALYQYCFAALEVGSLFPAQLHVPYLVGDLELLALLEPVRRA